MTVQSVNVDEFINSTTVDAPPSIQPYLSIAAVVVAFLLFCRERSVTNGLIAASMICFSIHGAVYLLLDWFKLPTEDTAIVILAASSWGPSIGYLIVLALVGALWSKNSEM